MLAICMLYFICIWLLMLPICLVIGNSFLSRLNATNLSRRGDRLIISLWLGLITLAIGLLATSLFVPLTSGVGFLVMLVMTGIAFVPKTTQVEFASFWKTYFLARGWLIVSLTTIVAAIMSRSVVWLDTGYYHSSSIKWLAQYGAVPGIALLFNNLGFTSSWFALTAPWNPASLVAHSSAMMAGFAWLISLGHLLISGRQIAQAKAQLSDWFAIIFMGTSALLNLFIKPFSQILVSPSPDLPIFLLVGTIAWGILVTSKSHSSLRSPAIDERILPLLLSAGAVTIKLTALPLLAVSSLFFVATQRISWRRIAIGIILPTIMLWPYLVSSVVASGCPLYPSNLLCFALPWSPTAQAAQQTAANTHNWVSWYGQPPTGANPWLWALGEMLRSSTKEVVIMGIVVVALGSALYVLTSKYVVASRIATKSILKKPISQCLQGEFWVCAIGITGIAFLMATSVFFRFLMPYALTLISLLLAIGLNERDPKVVANLLRRLPSDTERCDTNRCDTNRCDTNRSALSWVGLAVCAVVINLYQTTGESLFLPPAMPSDRLVRKETNGIIYTAPESGDVQQTVQIKQQLQKDMCWAAPLPCAYEISPEVHLRQPQRGIVGGFVRK